MAYTNVSNEFKEIVKSNSITASAKIIFPNLNLTILPHATDNLKSSLADLTIYDKCCDKGKYIGNAVAKKVELQLINKDNLDLADQEFELYVGVKLSNGEYEYIPYGNFIVTAYTDTKSNNKFKIEAYDYMTKLNGYFSNILYNEKTNPNGLKIDYPIKLKDFKEKILTYMGISYVDQTLPNDNFSIDTAINFDGYTIRNVIAKIAELQGTFARINRENKMEFCLQTQTDEEIPLSSMNNKQEINNRYGPVNVVSLTMKNVKGENVTLRDDKSIDKYGENTIEIQDNPFVYTEALREKAIEELYSALDGFSYYPINFNWKARLYTDGSDIIKVYDMRNKKWVNSIVMNQTIKIPATRQSTLESPALTKTQVANQYISQSKQANTRTEIIVDKQNQKIESVVNNVTEQNTKISQITQTVDEINSKISDIADITTYGESDRAEVELTDVNESEPIMIKVHPTSTNISYLYPNNNLLPSDTQYLPDRIIRFTRTYEEDGTTKTENIDYLLPDDLLRYSDTVYDEFYLNYESQTCQVIKRCAYNADGTVRALGTEITTDYPYPTITLGEGNYTITLPGYDFGYLYVRLMAKNIYTTQFYTKVETDSRINQKANEINLGVNQTLTNYSTTNEMNSAIKLKANEITSTVSKKVGKDEIISKINQSAESISIDANKLNINGVVSANGNFTVDTNGNMICNNGQFNGGKISLNNPSGNGGNLEMIGSTTSQISWLRTNQLYLSDDGSSINLQSSRETGQKGMYISDYGYREEMPTTNNYVFIGVNAVESSDMSLSHNRGNDGGQTAIICSTDDDKAEIWLLDNKISQSTYVRNSGITTPTVTQTSKESEKKNFEKLDSGLDIIKDIDIYKYNLKSEEDITKKHIGFVIGDNYNYSEEVTSNNNDGADIYSFVSVCCKAIQEQQEEIEELKKEIEKLKGGK